MKKFGIIAVALLFVLSYCKKDENSPSGANGTGNLELRLTDAPAAYDAVVIDIVGAEVHAANNPDSLNGWIPLNIVPGQYDLLKLSNGIDTLLGITPLPAGTISQIRLKLGVNSSIVVNGTTYPLEVPSGMQSGLKLNVHADIQPGLTYVILLDFDASKSIVETGNGQYKLKPVIRAITSVSSTGALRGTMQPADVITTVNVIQGSDTISSYSNPVSGEFYIPGLAAGTYTVWIDPAVPYIDTVFTTAISAGLLTNLGIVKIRK